MAIEVPIPRGFSAMFAGLMRAEELADVAGEIMVKEACARARIEFIALFAQGVMSAPLPGLESFGSGEILVSVERDDIKSFA